MDFWQILIWLADHSEYGWDAVKEYETDELAADNDDAKHLEKAEKAAEQRLPSAREWCNFVAEGEDAVEFRVLHRHTASIPWNLRSTCTAATECIPVLWKHRQECTMPSGTRAMF